MVAPKISSMRDFLNILGESTGPYLDGLVKLAKTCTDVEQFISKIDGGFHDVLYRGHSGGEVSNHVFMSDYIGHAREYGDQIDAYAIDYNDVMKFDNTVFELMRHSCWQEARTQGFAKFYRVACEGNRFSRVLNMKLAKSLIYGKMPYSEISFTPDKNDSVIPLMQRYAASKGKNIISFMASDYGGQMEFVVGDISRLIDLRKLYDRVRG